MRAELANLVLPVLCQGLNLHGRLLAGETPALETEQAALLALLQGEEESRRVPDFGGDARPALARAGRDGANDGDRFFGVRYALVCWLDELFILHSPWDRRWNERKLEVALYGTNDRAWQFWKQAELAAVRPTADPLEAFFLCVVLGFRGERAEEPARLTAWVETNRGRVIAAAPSAWQAPADLEVPTAVPPRHGLERLQRALAGLAAAILVLTPLAAFAAVRWLGR
jgi:type VI secretion system protein ImpK